MRKSLLNACRVISLFYLSFQTPRLVTELDTKDNIQFQSKSHNSLLFSNSRTVPHGCWRWRLNGMQPQRSHLNGTVAAAKTEGLALIFASLRSKVPSFLCPHLFPSIYQEIPALHNSWYMVSNPKAHCNLKILSFFPT